MNGLSSFFEESPVEAANQPIGGAILIDLSNVLFRAIYSSGEFNKAEDVQVPIIRHVIFNMLLRYRKMISVDKYPEMVVCFDGPNVWRKAIFPLYKANRQVEDKDATDEQIAFKTAVFASFGVLRDEIQMSSPFPTVRVDGAEADDVIAILAKQFAFAGRQVVIVSSDKDMRQLLKYKGVKIFSPAQGVDGGYVKIDDPEHYLFEQVIRGDGGDGVPNVLSPDDTFYPIRQRQKSIYASKVDEWKKLGDPKLWCSDPVLFARFQRNRTMIDMDQIPADICEKILEHYTLDQQLIPARRANLYKYFMEKGLKQHLSNINLFLS